MVQPVMAIGRFVKLLVLLPALTAKCDDSQAKRNQLSVTMRRADMQVLHVYSLHYPLLPPDSLILLTPPRIVPGVEQADQT